MKYPNHDRKSHQIVIISIARTVSTTVARRITEEPGSDRCLRDRGHRRHPSFSFEGDTNAPNVMQCGAFLSLGHVYLAWGRGVDRESQICQVAGLVRKHGNEIMKEGVTEIATTKFDGGEESACRHTPANFKWAC